MNKPLLIALVVAIVIASLGYIWFNKESFANYPGKNEFMKLYYSSVAEDPNFIKKFPYWGTGNAVGRRCRKPGNVGCDTIWISGRLVEITPTLKKNLECKFGLPFEKIIENNII